MDDLLLEDLVHVDMASLEVAWTSEEISQIIRDFGDEPDIVAPTPVVSDPECNTVFPTPTAPPAVAPAPRPPPAPSPVASPAPSQFLPWSDIYLRLHKHSVHRIDDVNGVPQHVVSKTKKFEAIFELCATATNQPVDKPLEVKFTVLYENGEVVDGQGQPLLEAPPTANFQGGRCTWQGKILSLTNKHRNRLFCLRVEPADAELAKAHPHLFVKTPAVRTVTKLQRPGASGPAASPASTSHPPPAGPAGAAGTLPAPPSAREVAATGGEGGRQALTLRGGEAAAQAPPPAAGPSNASNASNAELEEMLRQQREKIHLLTSQNDQIMAQLMGPPSAPTGAPSMPTGD